MASARSLTAKAVDIGLVFTLALALHSCAANGAHIGGRRGLAANSANPSVYDITKFGAKGDGSTNNFKAFLNAWIQVCESPVPAKLVVPTGTFLAGPVVFAGPCKSQVTVEVKGTIQATKGVAEYASAEWFLFEHLDNLILTGGGTFDGQGEDAWKRNGCDKNFRCKLPPTSLKFRHLNNAEVHHISSVNSKAFHMFLVHANNITIHNITLTAPDDSPNTDGIHLSNADHVKILDSNIGTGDDCVSVGRGSNDVTVERVVCGPGHGISVGSLGKYKNEEDVSGIHVNNCTLKGTDNGVRIKTWSGSPPSKATNIIFENIIMEKVKNPIIIDQEYGAKKGPSHVKISDVTFKNIRGTSITKEAVSFTCSSAVPCEGVKVQDVNLSYDGAPGAKDDPKGGSLISALCANAKIVFGGKLNFPICS